jgi:chemotaxis protein methyltransferase CheR
MGEIEPGDEELEIRLLLEAIYRKYHYDFRKYAFASVQRRVRSALRQFNLPTVSSLLERVIHDAGVFKELLQYLTVPTSEMFRDPEYYRAFRESVVPVLATYPSLRLWVAGCSTGEEVYSLAIVLAEEGLLSRTQIYATDINLRSLERAREGIYSSEEIRKFSVNYQHAGGKRSFADYYVAQYGAAQIQRDLTKHVVFSDHSLATDSVFAEMQYISCRNVLIYFDRELQDRAVALFRDSLCRGGFLGLGSKENLRFSRHFEEFEVFDQNVRIYRKRGGL